MSSEAENATLLPLGPFASAPEAGPWTGAELDVSSSMSPVMKARTVAYLSGCEMFLPWMSYTRDVIGDRFGVSGGSAICSDGTYYWRADAVEYIKEYGIPVPDEAIRHFERLGWKPPVLSREAELEIYTRLKDMFVLSEGDDDAVVIGPQ